MPKIRRHAASQADPQSGKVLILLAEDNRTNQRVSHALLHKLGYEADIVAHGLAALEALQAVPYDIIFIDCQMPQVDGYDATRAIPIDAALVPSGELALQS